MNMLILAWGTMALYGVAMVLQGGTLAGRWRLPKPIWWSVSALAVLGHAFLLYRWIDVGGGQNLTLVNVFSLLMWLTSVIIVASSLGKPTENLSVFVFPLSLISLAAAHQFPYAHIEHTARHPKALLHIWNAILAFSVLFIAAAQAILLAVQDALLRRRKANLLLQLLPPVETMETLLFQMIALGFILLTLMLVTSLIFFPQALIAPLLPKTVLSFMAWAVFAVLLWGRHVFGWRGRMAIRWTVFGVVLLVLAYFGTAIVT